VARFEISGLSSDPGHGEFWRYDVPGVSLNQPTLTLVKFLLALAGIVLFFIGILHALLLADVLASVPSFFYVTLFFMAMVTAVVYLYLFRIREPAHFTQFFLLLTVVKLIACLAYCTVMVIKSKGDSKINVVFFLAMYSVFTVAEVLFLYSKSRRGNA
jgi:hypothetical protein